MSDLFDSRDGFLAGDGGVGGGFFFTDWIAGRGGGIIGGGRGGGRGEGIIGGGRGGGISGGGGVGCLAISSISFSTLEA